MINASELDGIRRMLSEIDVKNGLRIFCLREAQSHTQECVNAVKQGRTLEAAFAAGKLDVYESLLNQLEHFVKTTQV